MTKANGWFSATAAKALAEGTKPPPTRSINHSPGKRDEKEPVIGSRRSHIQALLLLFAPPEARGA